MKCIKSEVVPSLNFVMVVCGVICTQIGAPGQHMAVMYYGENEPICLFTAIECDGIPSIYLI